MSVDFVTFCHPPRYAEKLHRPGVLRAIVDSHGFSFDDVIVVHQKCRAADYEPFDFSCQAIDLPREEFDPLLLRFDVDPDQPRAEELSHGEGAAHWWKAHLINHLCGLETSTADYVVFADCDTYMKAQPTDRSWIEEGIAILDKYPQVLIVSPGDGGDMHEARIPEARLTQNVSQQLFICRGPEFQHVVDFDVHWDGAFDAPGGPMQEFYVMLEGRLWRYMRQSDMWRAILPDQWRYWHDSYWGTT